MNKKIRRLAVGLLVLYLALFVQLNVIQVGKQQTLADDPRNDRQTLRDFNRPRGSIIAADGTVLATSVPVTDPKDAAKFQRVYPLGELFADVTGYYSLSYGATQLERTQSEVLAGTTSQQQLHALTNLLGPGDTSGTVVTTLRPDVQALAKQALGGREGSVVVVDPHTGAIIAMYSDPSYDPNQVADHDAKKVTDVLAFLNNYPGKPLLANAYQERYMPGSAFKVITMATALQDGVAALDRQWPVESSFTPPQTNNPIQNYGGHSCGGSMVEVFFRSCNTPFARLAVELGADREVAGTKAWGVGEQVPIDLPGAAASSFGQVADFKDNIPLLAIGGFGQGNDLMVPLHMAMLAATVANGGVMMKPHVIDETLYHDGTVLSKTQPTVWKTPIDGDIDNQMTQLMIQVVQQGTGTPMQLANGIQAAAKTGTAQLNATGQPQRSHAWIIGFAPASAPQYAVAVILKGTNDVISASTGGKLAGPIAKQILDYLFAHPTPVPVAPTVTTTATSSGSTP